MLKEGQKASFSERIELSKTHKFRKNNFKGHMIWKSCPKCGEQRWVRPTKADVICTDCNRMNRLILVDGYEVLSKGAYFERFGIKRSGSMVFFPCVKCGEKHWIARSDLKRKSATGVCRKCYNMYMSETLGEKRWNFNKDYRVKNGGGYIQIRINRGDPLSCMAHNDTFILEHRYIMAKHLGRPLGRWELVHHINGEKDDNRIENLKLVTLRNHRGDIVCPHCGETYTIG